MRLGPSRLFGSADVPLDSVAHVIQVALTPVFLLSGIGTLLNVINTRVVLQSLRQVVNGRYRRQIRRRLGTAQR